jgi:ERCC4-related helicase
VLQLLRHRTAEDLRWELAELNLLIERFGSITVRPSKMQYLLRVLGKRRSLANRVNQLVIFTRFADTLHDIVDNLRAIDPGLLLGTYSGEGGRYVDPKTRGWVGVDRDEIKHRFMPGEIDILVCTDAAAEGLNLQSADLLIQL